jgi:hypothetical protein
MDEHEEEEFLAAKASEKIRNGKYVSWIIVNKKAWVCYSILA